MRVEVPVSSGKNKDTSGYTHMALCHVKCPGPHPFIFSTQQRPFSKCYKPPLTVRAQNILFLCRLPKWKQEKPRFFFVVVVPRGELLFM